MIPALLIVAAAALGTVFALVQIRRARRAARELYARNAAGRIYRWALSLPDKARVREW